MRRPGQLSRTFRAGGSQAQRGGGDPESEADSDDQSVAGSSAVFECVVYGWAIRVAEFLWHAHECAAAGDEGKSVGRDVGSTV